MIQHQQDKYKWQFTYLGANQDAFATGGGMGIKTAGIANFAPQNTNQAYGAASNNVARMRSASAGGQPVRSSYTEEELKAMEAPK